MYGWAYLIAPKILYGLMLLLIVTYAGLWILGQFEWFKKWKDAEASFAFEAVLFMVALVMGFMGIWFNGYEKGFEDGSKST